MKENKPTVVNVMRVKGNLIPYLQSVNEQSDEMCCQLVRKLAIQEGVTEELKRNDQVAWVGAMNNICDRVNKKKIRLTGGASAPPVYLHISGPYTCQYG